MSRKKQPPPRGWQFWRQAFWTRPALLACCGLALCGFGLWMLTAVPGELGDGIAMQRAGPCPAASPRPAADVAPPAGCLERVRVTLSGPFGGSRRNPDTSWRLFVLQHGQSTQYAEADLPIRGSNKLTDGEQVEALLWEGRPVAIERPTGERIETSAWGHRGWLGLLLLAIPFAAVGLVLLDLAFRRRGAIGSWWSLRRGEKQWALSPLMRIAILSGVPTTLGYFALKTGLSPLWVAGITLGAAGLAGVLLWRGVVRRRPAAGAGRGA